MLPDEVTTTIECSIIAAGRQLRLPLNLMINKGSAYLVLNMDHPEQDIPLDSDKIQRSPAGAQAPYYYLTPISLQV